METHTCKSSNIGEKFVLLSRSLHSVVNGVQVIESSKTVRASSQTRLKTETETGAETLKMACKTLTSRYTDFFTDYMACKREKTTVLQSKFRKLMKQHKLTSFAYEWLLHELQI